MLRGVSLRNGGAKRLRGIIHKAVTIDGATAPHPIISLDRIEPSGKLTGHFAGKSPHPEACGLASFQPGQHSFFNF
jgi:hypothetical protein